MSRPGRPLPDSTAPDLNGHPPAPVRARRALQRAAVVALAAGLILGPSLLFSTTPASTQEATRIALGGSEPGRLDAAGEVLTYEFSGEAGQEVFVFPARCAAELELRASVADPDGEALEEWALCERRQRSGRWLTLESGGDHQVAVRGAGGGGAYQLAVKEIEPVEIPLGDDLTASGALLEEGERLSFPFTAGAGETLTVTVNCLAIGQADHQDEILFSIGPASRDGEPDEVNPCQREELELEYTPEEPGEHVVRVRGGLTLGGFSFTLARRSITASG